MSPLGREPFHGPRTRASAMRQEAVFRPSPSVKMPVPAAYGSRLPHRRRRRRTREGRRVSGDGRQPLACAGQRDQVRNGFSLRWSRTVPRTKCSAARRSATRCEATNPAAPVTSTLVEVLNVKTALFFRAVLPQFLDTAHPVAAQLVVIGTACVVLNTLVDVAAVLGAVKLLKSEATGRQRARLLNKASGLTLIALGFMWRHPIEPLDWRASHASSFMERGGIVRIAPR